MPLVETLRITHVELTSTKPEIPVREFESSREAARAAAQTILTTVIHKPDAAIMFATGNTMEPVYEELVSLANATGVDFSQMQAFHLDEYNGVSPKDSESFVGFLRKRVFDPLHIPESNRHEMRGDTGNATQEAARYNAEINKQPMDLVILGIGPGGHIAFNEPNTPFTTQTHVAPLSTETVTRDISRGQRNLTEALTVGIANILKAKELIIVGYGEEKGHELQKALRGPVTESCPASALQLVSDRVTAICDKPAAKQLRNT